MRIWTILPITLAIAACNSPENERQSAREKGDSSEGSESVEDRQESSKSEEGSGETFETSSTSGDDGDGEERSGSSPGRKTSEKGDAPTNCPKKTVIYRQKGGYYDVGALAAANGKVYWLRASEVGTLFTYSAAKGVTSEAVAFTDSSPRADRIWPNQPLADAGDLGVTRLRYDGKGFVLGVSELPTGDVRGEYWRKTTKGWTAKATYQDLYYRHSAPSLPGTSYYSVAQNTGGEPYILGAGADLSFSPVAPVVSNLTHNPFRILTAEQDSILLTNDRDFCMLRNIDTNAGSSYKRCLGMLNGRVIEMSADGQLSEKSGVSTNIGDRPIQLDYDFVSDETGLVLVESKVSGIQKVPNILVINRKQDGSWESAFRNIELGTYSGFRPLIAADEQCIYYTQVGGIVAIPRS